MEDLAEQSVDELIDIEGMDEKRAAEIIMTARAPWFVEEEGSTDVAGSDSDSSTTDSVSAESNEQHTEDKQ